MIISHEVTIKLLTVENTRGDSRSDQNKQEQSYGFTTSASCHRHPITRDAQNHLVHTQTLC
ncbi:hypothetical protein Bealeia2_02074 (plasmid) [Candidatus Bealeia paramacronuclearis]|nr:hypothetical protein [Candidatus Bealeia paramacronuclearis]